MLEQPSLRHHPLDSRRSSVRSAAKRATSHVWLAVALIATGCVGDDGFEPTVPRRDIGPVAAQNAPMTEAGFDYVWQQLPIGGGGWVTGMIIPPGANGLMYARTDVGGAYRWDPDAQRWTHLLTIAGATSYTPEENDQSVESIAAAPSDPSVVYLAVGDDAVAEPDGEQPDPTGRVLVSSDSGQTWSASAQRFLVGGNLDHRQRSDRLAVDPANPDVALLGTRIGGMWRTVDRGVTWTRVNKEQIPIGKTAEGDETTPAGVSFVSFDPGSADSAAPTAYAGVAGVGVFRSDDSGVSWKRIAEARDDADAPFEGSIIDHHLYVAWKQTDREGNGRIERYERDADKWTTITPDQDGVEWSIAVDPSNPDHLVAANDAVTEGRVWRSTNGGQNWDQVDFTTSSKNLPWYDQKDMADWMSIGRLVIDPDVPGRLWFAEGLGVWRADDVFSAGEVVFENESMGIEQTVAAKVAAPPGGDPVSAIADVQGFRHRDLTTYPTTQIVDGTFAGGTDIDWSGKNPQVMVWAGAEYQRYWDEDRPGRGAITRDGGKTWTPLPNLSKDQFGGNIAISATDPDNIVWVPSYYLNPWEFQSEELKRGVFVTSDGGENWTELDGIDGSHRFHRLMWWFARQALASDKVEGGVFYLNDDEERFLVSIDGGATWNAAAHAPPCQEANGCHVHGQLKASPDRAGEIWASVGDDGLYRSADRGASPWTKIGGVDEVESFDFGAPMPGSDRPTIYLYGKVQGDQELGIWRSPDDGQTWTLIGRRPRGVVISITNVNGDMDEPGRVYVSFGGMGIAYGEDPSL